MSAHNPYLLTWPAYMALMIFCARLRHLYLIRLRTACRYAFAVCMGGHRGANIPMRGANCVRLCVFFTGPFFTTSCLLAPRGLAPSYEKVRQLVRASSLPAGGTWRTGSWCNAYVPYDVMQHTRRSLDTKPGDVFWRCLTPSPTFQCRVDVLHDVHPPHAKFPLILEDPRIFGVCPSNAQPVLEVLAIKAGQVVPAHVVTEMLQQTRRPR